MDRDVITYSILSFGAATIVNWIYGYLYGSVNQEDGHIEKSVEEKLLEQKPLEQSNVDETHRCMVSINVKCVKCR